MESRDREKGGRANKANSPYRQSILGQFVVAFVPPSTAQATLTVERYPLQPREMSTGSSRTMRSSIGKVHRRKKGGSS